MLGAVHPRGKGDDFSMNDAMQRVVDGDLDALGQLRPFLVECACRIAKGGLRTETDDIAHGVMVSLIKGLTLGKIEFSSVGELRGKLYRMTQYHTYNLARERRTEAAKITEAAHGSSTTSLPDVWARLYSEDVAHAIDVVQDSRNVTVARRRAFARRLEMTRGIELKRLLERDGRLDPSAPPDEVELRVQTDGRLQRTALDELQQGVADAVRRGLLDEDTAALTTHFLQCLKQRQDSAPDAPDGDVASDGSSSPDGEVERT
jgi:hypothetical protein